MTTGNVLLDAALDYAGQGFPVFPLHSPVNGGCSCRTRDCDDIGKHPRTKHGLKDATTDEATIRKWWKRWPDANIGVVTGATSGFVVLDIDGANGEASVADKHLPDTPSTKTGRGRHLLFAYPRGRGKVKNFTKKLPGVDFRGDGGYIVAPPSKHENGERYEWVNSLEDVPLADLPDWVLDLIFAKKLPSGTAEGNASEQRIPKLTRNDTLTSIAGRYRRHGMERPEIEAALLAINQSRCVPPLFETEVRGIAASVVRYRSAEQLAADNGRVRCMTDVVAEKVDFLWDPYIPLGKLTMLDGDPGVGKSFASLAIAAAVSRGKGLPNTDATKPETALLFTAEDGLGDTVRPRLDQLDANLERIFAYEGLLELKGAGVSVFEALIQEHQPALVVLDPLVAYMGPDLDLHRANQTRALMATLAEIADRWRCAVVLIRHLTKGQRTSALYRGLGSIDIVAACRSVLLVGTDPNDDERRGRAIVQIKSNLAQLGSSLGYAIADDGFSWTGRSELTAAQILGAPENGSASRKLEVAKEFLLEFLNDGPRPATEIREAAEDWGISPRTLRRAKEALEADSYREGEQGRQGGGSWIWELPEDASLDGQEPS